MERDYFENVFRPRLKAAGPSVEYLGELDQPDRDQLFAESYASLMPGSWPEPFGLVLIESLACGTPVIARRIGGLPEILRDGSMASSATTSRRWRSRSIVSLISIGEPSVIRSSTGSRSSA